MALGGSGGFQEVGIVVRDRETGELTFAYGWLKSFNVSASPNAPLEAEVTVAIDMNSLSDDMREKLEPGPKRLDGWVVGSVDDD